MLSDNLHELRIMGVLAILGALGLIAFDLMPDTFGFPGTPEYETYERLNRLLGLAVLLAGLGYLGAALRYGTITGRIGQFGTIALAAGFVIMVTGNVMEFWFFTDQPYGENNMRAVSFALFLLGMLIVLIGAGAQAGSMWSEDRIPRWIPILMGTTILGVLLGFSFGILLLSIAVPAMAFGLWLILRTPHSKSDLPQPFVDGPEFT